MEKKVAILMSTYNGERYLDEQIQSIINQTYSNWVLYIRDDGSNDNTPQIIEKYANSHQNIIFFNQENIKNVGVVRSFMDLLEHVSADYYMFSDQDDVWLKDRVKDIINSVKQNEPGPACVFTDLEIVNQELTPIRRMNGENVWTDFLLLLFTNCITGCAMALNDELKGLIKFNEINYRYVFMHDWWIGLLAAAFGKLVYLDKTTILYRQHGDNVVGENKKNTLSYLFYRATHHKPERAQIQHSVNLAYEFNREYPKALSGRNKQYVTNYASLKNKSTFWHNLRLVSKLPPQRGNPKGRLFFSYLMLAYHKDFIG